MIAKRFWIIRPSSSRDPIYSLARLELGRASKSLLRRIRAFLRADDDLTKSWLIAQHP
jgi:hypothetical protein